MNGFGFVSCCRVAPGGGDGVVLSGEFHSIALDFEGAERGDADSDCGRSSVGKDMRTDTEPNRKRFLFFADDADKLAKEDLVALVDVVRSVASEGIPPLLVLACRDLPVDLLQIKGVSLVTGAASGSGSGAVSVPIYVRPIGDLSRQETALLISDTTCRSPSPDLVDWMARRAAGNPLFTRELIAHLTTHEYLRESSRGLELGPGAETAVLPESITSILHKGARGLPPDQLRVAEVTSLGPGATVAAIAQITGLSGTAVDELTRILVRCGILRPGNPVDEQVFNHELLRDIIYEGIPASDRRQLHERVAEIWQLMADAHPSDARRNRVLAWHLFRGHHPRAAAGSALNAVAGLTRDGRADESMHYLHILETLGIDALDADASAVEILLRIAQDYWRLGRTACCARACELGIALASSCNCMEQPVPPEFTTLLAKAHVLSGDLGQASQILEDVLPEAEQRADPALLVKTYYGLCMIHQMSGVFAEMARSSEQCLAASERSADTDLILLGYCAKANSLIALCEWEASKEWYLDAAEIQRNTSRRRALATTLGNLGRAHMFLGEWSAADDYLEQSSALAHELACEYSLGLTFGNHADLQMRRGALAAAAGAFREAIAHAELAGDDWGLASVLSDLGELEHIRGSDYAALELFDRSEEL
ncbi:MAG: tetratricopeptide repeat protein, partial [Candidatus Eisenbacteria sp.]|nr:tetratricopeptide repeat protein [Candidatus Eisenbacteria bacterium]